MRVVQITKLHDLHYMITASVRHSQKLSVAPAKPWVAVKQNGIVVGTHCTCMAGLGEACSHIAALLFTLEGNTKMKKNVTCTSLPRSWLPPSFQSVPYAVYPIYTSECRDTQTELYGATVEKQRREK